MSHRFPPATLDPSRSYNGPGHSSKCSNRRWWGLSHKGFSHKGCLHLCCASKVTLSSQRPHLPLSLTAVPCDRDSDSQIRDRETEAQSAIGIELGYCVFPLPCDTSPWGKEQDQAVLPPGLGKVQKYHGFQHSGNDQEDESPSFRHTGS